MKEALGWTWGTQSKTLRVTAKRLTKALTLLDDILAHNRVSIKRWQTLVGVLRSLQPGMSGSDGYFSLLQEALMRPVGGRIRLTSALKEQLHLFRDLLLGHESRPTELEELVPGVDINIGACDAAKPGRGGVWFLHDGRAVVWREPYPQKVQDQVVSLASPNGSLTNSDLELEGTILQHFVLGKITPVAGETSYTGCDNTPAVMWRQKGSSTTQRTRARLLRLASGLRRHQRAHHRIGHLAGTDNQMADDASRLWNLSDTEFLAYFNSTYPQNRSWSLLRLPSAVNCLMTSLLLDKTSNAEFVLNELQKLMPFGPSGQTSAPPTTGLPTSPASPTPSPPSFCSARNGETAPSPRVANRFELERRKTPCVRWARPFPFWGSSTHATPGTLPHSWTSDTVA